MAPGYNVKGGKVYYKPSFPNKTFVIEEADAATFKTLPNMGNAESSDPAYAVDKNHVFYRGGMVEGSHGPSFKLIAQMFAKDKGQVYREGMLIQDADPASFEPKDDVFSVDKGHVFRYTKTIDNDASVFELYSGYIVRTANCISAYDMILPLQPGQKTRYYGHSYFAIDDQVYFVEKPLEDADAVSFKVLRDWCGMSKDHVYYSEKMVLNADPAHFQLLAAPFAKDNNRVFFFERTIEGADPGTFEIVNEAFQCSRDKNAVYKEDKRIENFTPEDLINKKHCNNCSEKYIFFAE